MAERVGFEPTMGDTHTPLAGARLQPLGHLSKEVIVLFNNICVLIDKFGIKVSFPIIVNPRNSTLPKQIVARTHAWVSIVYPIQTHHVVLLHRVLQIFHPR